MAEAMQQMRFERQRDRENAAHERENLLLRLELLMRSDRRLPSIEQPEDDKDVLQKQIEALKKENEQLRKQLHQQSEE